MNKVKLYYNAVMRAVGYMLPAFIFGVLYEAITAINFITDRGGYTVGVVYTIAILMLYTTARKDVDDVRNYEQEEKNEQEEKRYE